jgi:hypothetical protein
MDDVLQHSFDKKLKVKKKKLAVRKTKKSSKTATKQPALSLN